MATETLDLAAFANWCDRRAAVLEKPPLETLTPICKQLALADAKSNFAESHDPDGVAWKPTAFRVRGLAGAKPLWNTGVLAAATAAEDTPTGFVIFNNTDYARTNQEGATILPKGMALSIPLTVEAQRAGGARNFPRPLSLVWPRGASSGWLQEKKQKGQKGGIGQALRQYLLVSKVVVPQRKFLGVGERLRARFGEAIFDWAGGLFDGA